VSEPSYGGQDAGRLRTFLGTAPGVGKTYAMLNEAHRLADNGDRVVVGWMERHGRAETEGQLGDLEIVPPRDTDYRGTTFEELDVDAVIAARPDVVLVDELAHTNVDRARKRWEDAAELMAAGISVMTTVNIANLTSVRDYAARVTGTGLVESVPDDFVRAGEVVLVDLDPEVLRRRIAEGSVYSADAVGGALGSYFRATNLAALSELAQAWLAEAVETSAPGVLARLGLDPLTPSRTVLAGVTDSPWGESVIRRAALMAAEDEAELLVVHVNLTDGLAHPRAAVLDRYRAMTSDAGGRFRELDGANAADTLARTAREEHATRVVVARHRSRLGELMRGSVASRIRRLNPGVTVDEVRRPD
jgi:two-component system, OmpR family, sensor histidine kinase KdpD